MFHSIADVHIKQEPMDEDPLPHNHDEEHEPQPEAHDLTLQTDCQN